MGLPQIDFLNYPLQKGGYPKSGEALVGNSIYHSLKNKNTIKIAHKTFSISGVFKSDIGFENGGVVLNIKDASKIFNKSASMLMVNSLIGEDSDKIINQIESLSKDVEAKSTQNFVDNYNQFKIIQTSSNLIGFISFFLGLLGIVIIMTITINQRKSEFGIKRALGISTKKIVLQTILESLILGIIAFITSLLISKLAIYFIKNSELFHGYVNGEISNSLAFYLFLCSTLMAVLGSIIPAINASKTDPIILIQGDKI